MINVAEKLETMGGLDYIKKMRYNGKTQKEVAISLGYKNPKVIYNYLKKQNILWSDLPVSEELEHKSINQIIYDRGGLSYIISLKNKGYTLNEIAHELGYKSSVPLKEYFKRNNIIWKNLGYNRTSSGNRIISNDKQIIKLVDYYLDEGYNLGEIYKITGISSPYLNHIFRRNGLSLKKFSYREHVTPIIRLINDYGGVDYLVDKNVNDIAEEFGYSLNYIKSEIRKYLKDSPYCIRGDVVVEKEIKEEVE